MNERAPLRFSRLKKMAQSPAHYLADVPIKSSAIDIGSAADLLILGGRRVVAYPGKVRNGKDWEAFAADNADALILTGREYEIATGIADSVLSDPEACRVLEGDVQRTMHWDRQGRACCGTPDVIAPGRYITDLKTGETADPRRFPWKMRAMAYHAQLAWYREGAYAESGVLSETCYIVAVEQKPPFVPTVFKLSEHVLDLGSRLCRLWFEQLLVCEATNEWPGYAQTIVDLDLPDQEDGNELIEIASAGVEE